MKKGIDVSYHQGFINFDMVKSDGVDFVIPRIGYSIRKDEMFEKYVKGFENVDIDIKGVYLFSYALSVDQAVTEANFAVATLNALNMRKETIIFYDLEQDSIRYAKERGVVIGEDEFMAFTKAFCDRVIELGYVAGVYFNMDYYRNMYSPELLDDYVKWLADWSGDADVKCAYHQYSSKGKVKGIPGNVDMNYLYSLEDNDEKNLDEIVLEIFRGEWGNGDDRKNDLKFLGYDHEKIQDMVNKYDVIADQVIEGKWGNGDERKSRIDVELKDFDYDTVQGIVNIKLKQEG